MDVLDKDDYQTAIHKIIVSYMYLFLGDSRPRNDVPTALGSQRHAINLQPKIHF